MQRKYQEKELPPTSQNIMATILQSIPKEASVTKIEYERTKNCSLYKFSTLLDGKQ